MPPMSQALALHAPRPRNGAHSGCMLKWEALGLSEFASVAQQLSTPDVVLKPKELHLTFNWGILRSTKYSRFRKVKVSHTRRRYGTLPPLASRSNTMTSVRSMMTVSADVGVLITHPVRRESTYIVWGGIMAVDSPTVNVPTRNVLVKIAVDEEGSEDLREDARLHEDLAERGLSGYYGIFTDSIGSTALVIDDFEGPGELTEVESPTP